MISDMQLLRSLQGLFKTQGQDAFPIGELLGLAPSLLTDNNSKVNILLHTMQHRCYVLCEVGELTNRFSPRR